MLIVLLTATQPNAPVKEDTMNRRKSSLISMAAISTLALASLAGCGGGGGETESTSGGESGGGSATGTDPAAFTVLVPNENPVVTAQLTKLSENQCSAENEALPIEFQSVAQGDVVQRITLLAGQDGLPTHFVAGTAQVKPDGDLGSTGMIVDYEKELGDTEVWDSMLPAAVSTVKDVYGGMVSIPYQYNIEGFWYNKQIFADNGIEEPKTWDELLAAGKKLKEAGIAPIAAAGGEGWPLTRYIGMYIHRLLGPDAMNAIADGSAKLTDPDYVAGAQALVDLIDAGMFVEGFVSEDWNAADNDFFSGKAAMKFDASRFVSDVTDESLNPAGDENIGFMPFPAVPNGQGTIDQWSANAGTAFAAASGQFGPKTEAWIGCIIENFGQQALQDSGTISGMAINGEVTDLPEITAEIQERISEIDETVLWFEARFDPKTNSLASSDVSLLATGQMTPEEYMADLQSSIDANK